MDVYEKKSGKRLAKAITLSILLMGADGLYLMQPAMAATVTSSGTYNSITSDSSDTRYGYETDGHTKWYKNVYGIHNENYKTPFTVTMTGDKTITVTDDTGAYKTGLYFDSYAIGMRGAIISGGTESAPINMKVAAIGTTISGISVQANAHAYGLYTGVDNEYTEENVNNSITSDAKISVSGYGTKATSTGTNSSSDAETNAWVSGLYADFVGTNTVAGTLTMDVMASGGESYATGATADGQGFGLHATSGGTNSIAKDAYLTITAKGGNASSPTNLLNTGVSNWAYAEAVGMMANSDMDPWDTTINTVGGNATINVKATGGAITAGSIADASAIGASADAIGLYTMGGTNRVGGNAVIDADAATVSLTNNAEDVSYAYALADTQAGGLKAEQFNGDGTNTIAGNVMIKARAASGTAVVTNTSSQGKDTTTASATANAYGLSASEGGTNTIEGDAFIDSMATGGSASAIGANAKATASAVAAGLVATADGWSKGGVNTIKGNVSIATNAVATQQGEEFHAYSLDATDSGINDVSSTGKTKILSGDVYATSAGVNKLVLDTAGSYLQGNIIDGDGTGDNEISISNGAEWRPVYDNTNGTDCVVNTDANAATINVKSNTVDTRSADALKLYDGGVVNLLWDGNRNTYRTLDIGTLSGNGGVFNIATDLASQTDGDKINVTTGEAGSTQYITVYDASLDTGNIVTGPKQLLVATDESGNYTFAGKTLDTGGLWETTPTIENLEGNNWYLTMLAAKPNPSTEGVLGTVDSLYGFWRNTLLDDTLRKRLGDLRYGGEDVSGAWARIKAGKMNADLYDGNYQMYQAGYDKKSGHTAYGLAIDYDKASYDVTDGSSDDTGLGLSLYGTTYHDSGFYNDWILRAGKVKAEMDTYGTYPDSLDYSTWCYSLSYELGKTFRHDNGWFIEPQAQLVYGHMRGGDFTTDRGVDVNRDSIDSLLGRAGFVVGRKINDDKDFYFKANVYHEFAGDGDMHLNYDTQNMYYDGDHKDTWFEAGFGANLKMNDSTYLYGDVLKTFGADINKKWQVNLGLRWAFGGPKKEKAVEPASV
jgi:outer membrane autotransporter protein